MLEKKKKMKATILIILGTFLLVLINIAVIGVLNPHRLYSPQNNKDRIEEKTTKREFLQRKKKKPVQNVAKDRKNAIEKEQLRKTKNLASFFYILLLQQHL